MNKSINHPIKCTVGITIILFSVFTYSAAASLNFRIDKLNKVYISAEDVSVEDILNEISSQTGIILDSTVDLSRTISIIIENETIEKSLQLILADQNYVLLFKKTGDSVFVPMALKIFPHGADLEPSKEDSGGPEKNLQGPSDEKSGATSIKSFNRAAFKDDLGDLNALVGQIMGNQTAYGEGTEDIGVLITGVPRDSVFSKIGIAPGNIIINVNKTPVTSVWEFLREMNAVYIGKKPEIRIERLKSDREYDPIYIKFIE